MKKLILFCTLLFSSSIAFALLLSAYSSASGNLTNLIATLLLFFGLLFLVSLSLAIIEVYKKEKK